MSPCKRPQNMKSHAFAYTLPQKRTPCAILSVFVARMLTPILNHFIYHPEAVSAPPDFTPAQLGLTYEEVTLRTQDDVNVCGWYLPAPAAKGAVLYLHGNAGDCRDWVMVAPKFLGAGYSIFILDYRGYGKSAGKPSEKGLYRDGEAAWAWLSTLSQAQALPAFILGKSLGSGVATWLGSKIRPAGLILDSAYTSMREVVAHNAPWLPTRLIPKFYESLARAANITCPTLLTHGDRDTLIPVAHSLRLYQKLRAPKALNIIPGAGHNNVDGFSRYDAWLMAFMHDPAAFVAAHQTESETAVAVYLPRGLA